MYNRSGKAEEKRIRCEMRGRTEMKTYQKEELLKYVKNDWILEMLHKEESIEEKEIRTNLWMKTMENKRMIYADVYGDILRNAQAKRVLDVGGGYCALTKVLARNVDYILLDFLAHGGKEYVRSLGLNLVERDWWEVELEGIYDIVIANDIFPDADQRLELFIEKMLPICKELRIVLTYYNTPKFYQTKRVDDSEIMTFLSWDGEITALKLRKYLDRIMDTSQKQLEEMKDDFSSIYWNGRQVSYIKMRGDIT